MSTLYRGGFVYSPVDPFANAMVVDDATGSIAWIGGDDAAAVHADVVDEVVELDGAANADGEPERLVTTPGSRVAGLVVPTNEELEIARSCLAVLGVETGL